jgi:two-component system OmpR family response regulator
MKSLFVENEPEMAMAVGSLLATKGFDVSCSRSIQEATKETQKTFFDLAVVKRCLPDGHELAFVAICRRFRLGRPVIVLSALREPDGTVLSLDTAADDFLAKPFPNPEFIARTKAFLLTQELERRKLHRIRHVTSDPDLRKISVDANGVAIDRREIALLEALIKRRPGPIITRETLILRTYGENTRVQQHTLDTLIWRLRRRLDGVARRLPFLSQEASAIC